MEPISKEVVDSKPDAQLEAVRNQIHAEGGEIVEEWLGAIQETTDEGTCITARRRLNDVVDDEVYTTIIKNETFESSDKPNASKGEHFFLTFYKIPGEEDVKSNITFVKPRILSEEEKARAYALADRLFDNE